MAEKVVKIKIKNIADDLQMKSKDVVTILESCNVKGKSVSGSLEIFEFSALLNKLTLEKQIKNFDDYVNGVVDIDRSRLPKKEEKVETKQIEDTPKTKTEDKKEETIKETKPETVVSSNVEQKADNQGNIAPKNQNVQQSQAQKQETKPKQDQNINKQQPKQDQNINKQQPKQDQTQNKQQPNQDQNKQQPQKQSQQSQPKQQTQNKVQEQKKLPSFTNERGASKNADRFVKPQQQQQTNKKDQHKQDNQKQNRPQTIMQGGGEQVKTEKKTKIVDTHAPSFDSSKYEYDKYDIYSNDNRRNNDNASSKQKLKKKNNNVDNKSRKENEKKFIEHSKKAQLDKLKKQPLKVTIPDEITVSDLAAILKVNFAVVTKKLLENKIFATPATVLDFDTAEFVAVELGAVVTKEVVVTIEDKLFEKEEDIELDENAKPRDPVVCVMGHVDHGKTSLLDAIRNTRVTAQEAGGITQSIGAYRVKINDKYITFLDTPGHEAFGAMRARGAEATDIAILVVAADDGIMPQTIEAIKYAKDAKVSIIVAINKIDKPGAKPEEIKQALMKYDLIPEEWGGDTMCVNVSALKKTGIDELLEDVLLVAEFKELKANPLKKAKGVIIEAALTKGLGPTATVLVQNGTLHHGDFVIAGTSVGRIKLMKDETGKVLKEAGPSVPVVIVGLDTVPQAGDVFNSVDDEKMARELVEKRKSSEKNIDTEIIDEKRASLDDLFEQIKMGVKDLNILIKADVRGSAEAVKASLEKLSNDEVRVNVISSGVGGITENDVNMASASNAIIIGFNVRPDKIALDSAESNKVEIRTYRVIYECIEEIKSAIKGMLKPVFKEVIIGHAIVRQTIRVPNVGTIAGAYVQDGKITRSSMVRIVRDGVVIFEDNIASLRRFKDDVKEVATSYECGIGLEKFNDIRENDILEVYVNEQIANQ